MTPWAAPYSWTIYVDAATLAGTCSAVTTTVTATAGVFNSAMVGRDIVIATVGTFEIVSYTSPTEVEVDGDASCSSKAFTVNVDDSGALTEDVPDEEYSRDGAAATVTVTKTATDTWEIVVTAKTAQTVNAIWVPWMGTQFSTLTGRFYNTRLAGNSHDIATAQHYNDGVASGVSGGGTTLITATSQIFDADQDDSVADIVVDGVGTFPIVTFVNGTNCIIAGVHDFTSKAVYIAQHWATIAFAWQGDDGAVYQYPGDYWYPGVGYDDGTTATWVGGCDYDKAWDVLFSLGRLGLKRSVALTGGQADTVNVYIGETATPATARQRIGTLVNLHGRATPRPSFLHASPWDGLPGVMALPTQDWENPAGRARAIWASHGTRLPGFIVWGLMSEKYDGTSATGCCLIKNAVLRRNQWVYAFADQIQSEGGIIAAYCRPMVVGDADTVITWMKCLLRWCDGAYGDTIGTLTDFSTLQYPELMLERGSLQHPNACLISGVLTGGPGVSIRDPNDSAESIPNAGIATPKPWTKTEAWMLPLFMDSLPSGTYRPVKRFLGEQNNDAGYPSWVFDMCFLMGCAVVPRSLDGEYPELEEVLTEWERIGFWTADDPWLYRDKVLLANGTAGVDFRRFTNRLGETLIVADFQDVIDATVTVDVNSVTKTITRVGRLTAQVV